MHIFMNKDTGKLLKEDEDEDKEEEEPAPTPAAPTQHLSGLSKLLASASSNVVPVSKEVSHVQQEKKQDVKKVEEEQTKVEHLANSIVMGSL